MAEILAEKGQFEGDGSISSISQARRLARNYANKLENEELVELNSTYEKLSKTITDNNIKLEKSQRKYVEEITQTKKAIEEMLSSGKVEFEDTHKHMETYIKDLEKLTQNLLSKDLDESVKNRLRGYTEVFSDVREEIAKDTEVYKESSKSMLDSLSKSLNNLKTNLRDMSLVSSASNIEKGLGVDKKYKAYNAMRTNFGMSSGDYSQFVKGLTAQNFSQGIGIGSKYSFDDAVEYMSKLSQLGINNEKQARDMYNTVVLGTKYLGMTTETQAKILDISRRNGNMDLLNKTNKTMVQIMNAQLGISKEQLNATLSQSASMADLSTMFSGNQDAILNFEKEAAAITSVYGEETAKSAQNIAQDILSNTYNSRYLGILGGDFNDILGKLQRGESGALEQIVSASKNSSLSGTAASSPYARTAMEESGMYDNNIMTLYNATAKDGKTVKGELNKIGSASDDTNKFLKDIKTGLSEKLGNLASWIQGAIPLQSLQTLYYTAALAEMGLNAAKGIINIGKQLPGLIKDIKTGISIFKDGGSIGDILNVLKGNLPASTEGIGAISKTTKLTSLNVASLGKVLQFGGGIALIAAGVVKGISDAKEATKKADEWKTSKTSAGIGGFLGGSSDNVVTRIFGKVLQYGAIGAGIGTLIAPGIGTAIGAVIGGLVGVLMGGIGGKSIAKGIDGFGSIMGKLFGGEGGSGGPAGQISVNTTMPKPYNATNGKGGSTEDALKALIHSPWHGITSMFGNRPNPFGGNATEDHGGMDIGAPRGTPIGSATSGIVDYVFGGGYADNDYTGGGFGNHVSIKGDNGVFYTYAHMNQAPSVSVGQRVKAGQAIGVVGSTGRSTGPHLHFQTGTSRYGRMDPVKYLNSGVLYPGSGSVKGLSGYNLMDEDEKLKFKESKQIVKKIVSADTKGGKGGPADNSQGIINSVDNGFQALLNKLDELNNRQDQQEEMMKALVSGSSNRLYKM